MDTAARTLVADIRERAQVSGCYLVRTKTLRTARNGKPYLILDLIDRTGSIEGRAWDDAERLDVVCEVGAIVEVAGRASSYQGKLQLNVDGAQRVPPEAVILEDFLPRSEYALDDLYAALRGVVADVRDPWLRALLDAIVDDADFARRLRVAVAAKVMHHAYLGGLVEHVVSMARIAVGLCEHYERLYPGMLDRDLLVAGVVLHDIGKVMEISTTAAFDYTDEGRLVGHIVMGVELIAEKARAIEGFPADRLAQVKHMVVAHHGKLEFGSPRTPHMPEALLLHLVDMVDSRMNAIHATFRDEAGQPWTRYNRMLEASLLNPFAAVPVDENGRALLPERDAGWLSGTSRSGRTTDAAPAKRTRKRSKRRVEANPQADAAASTEPAGEAPPSLDEPAGEKSAEEKPAEEGPSNLSLF